MTRTFVLLSHAVTSPSFLLRDLPGSGRRMDVVCRGVQAALFLSHGVREDAVFLAVLHGPPRTPATLRFEGAALRKVHPDERVLAIFVQKALEALEGAERRARAPGAIPADDAAPSAWVGSTPGVSARRLGLAAALDELGGPVVCLREGGEDVRGSDLPEGGVYVFGDYLDPEPAWEAELASRRALAVSVGPRSLFASHAMVLVHNELDRRARARAGRG